MSNKREDIFRAHAEALGLEVYRGGWPDFLVYKRATNEAYFVEVKQKIPGKIPHKYKSPSKSHRRGPKSQFSHKGLRRCQVELLIILRRLGLKVKVVFID